MSNVINSMCVSAFLGRSFSFKRSNRYVFTDVKGDTYMRLHGNLIALIDKKGKLSITLAGWCTRTTIGQLNALEGVHIKVKGGIPYLNGNEIDINKWYTIERYPREFGCF